MVQTLHPNKDIGTIEKIMNQKPRDLVNSLRVNKLLLNESKIIHIIPSVSHDNIIIESITSKFKYVYKFIRLFLLNC